MASFSECHFPRYTKTLLNYFIIYNTSIMYLKVNTEVLTRQSGNLFISTKWRKSIVNENCFSVMTIITANFTIYSFKIDRNCWKNGWIQRDTITRHLQTLSQKCYCRYSNIIIFFLACMDLALPSHCRHSNSTRANTSQITLIYCRFIEKTLITINSDWFFQENFNENKNHLHYPNHLNYI